MQERGAQQGTKLKPTLVRRPQSVCLVAVALVTLRELQRDLLDSEIFFTHGDCADVLESAS